MIFNLMKPVPTTESATMYSYNGTVLPALPEWDKEKYPYAVIVLGNFLPAYKNNVTLYVFQEIDFTGGALQYNSRCLKTDSADYTAEDFTWSELAQCTSAGGVSNQFILWANTDIYYPDDYEWNGDTTKAGTVFLSASEPVPIYE